MADTEPYYADVLLPLSLPGTYTYRVPRELQGQVAVGKRVVVQFGNRKVYAALVRKVHQQAPGFITKYIIGVLDAEPIVSDLHLRFWHWIAEYYMCHPGDVMQVALPAGMKLASTSALSIHPDWDGELSSLTKYERQVVDMLSQHQPMKLDDISRALGIQKIMPLVRGMIERQIVIMDEELRERFVPRKSTYLTLAPQYNTDDSQRALFDSLERSHRTKQVELLMQYMQLSHFGKDAVAKRQLPKGSAIQTLVRNGILVEEQRAESTISAVNPSALKPVASITLNQEQQQALDTIERGKPVSLLHGVTASGKTEVYIKLIDCHVQAGHQVLFLLPEIALTTQVINRLQQYFGDKVGVYHSRFSASRRVEVWNRTAAQGAGRYQVLLGARSALFLPFTDLSLIIVDEEHDPSYKQIDPAPRYHARDAAVYLASLWGARTVLGSATPSIESYSNAQKGKYTLAVMQHRYGGYALPTIECVDMKQATQSGQVKGHFSTALLTAVDSALKQGQQAILYQNRRGFSWRIECDDCHHVPQCIHCDVSLVYHKDTASLRCHYCGYSIPVPSQCPACGSTHLRMTGIGTERIEEDLQILFPDASIARMDLDSTTQKNRYVEMLNDFAARRIDILVGTQMITKGLDFENVSVVGVVSADNIINYPSFRSYERAFQQLTQVSGRAGRHQDAGRVIIQTFNPSHQVIQKVIDGDYTSLYAEQDIERRVFRYPPYFRLVEVTLKHTEQAVVNEAADWLAERMRATFGGRVMGPEYPLVSRIRALYLKRIAVRFERSEAVAEAKLVMMQMASDLHKQKSLSGVAVVFDADPY